MKKFLLLFAFLSFACGLFAQVAKTINLATAGTLSTSLTANELSTITNLTITGTIDARDFKTMLFEMPLLAVLDISGATIVAYKGNAGTNDGSNDYAANEIPAFAFFNPTYQLVKTSLTSVVLPSSVTSIGKYAFIFCSGLTTVTIPSSVTFIGESAFSGCSGLTTVVIPSSVTSIGLMAFVKSSGLITVDSNNPNYSSLDGVLYDKAQTTLISCPISKTGSFTIPSSVTSIAYNAFAGCSGLSTVEISSSVTSIGDYAFSGCSGLTSVEISSSVTSIGNWAFFNCSRLASVTIPSSVTSIGYWAFYNCSGLTTVTIPSSVTAIGGEAFAGCSALTSITTSRITPLDLSSKENVFKDVNKTTCILYVPVGSKSAYQAANQWKDFTNIVEKDITAIDPMISDQQLTVYPNPTTGKVRLVFDQVPQRGTTLTVNDFTGKTILTRFIQNKEEGIDLSGYSSGVYMIQTNSKDFKVQKVILK